jgi:hypothetical protein
VRIDDLASSRIGREGVDRQRKRLARAIRPVHQKDLYFARRQKERLTFEARRKPCRPGSESPSRTRKSSFRGNLDRVGAESGLLAPYCAHSRARTRRLCMASYSLAASLMRIQIGKTARKPTQARSLRVVDTGRSVVSPASTIATGWRPWFARKTLPDRFTVGLWLNVVPPVPDLTMSCGRSRRYATNAIPTPSNPLTVPVTANTRVS